MQSGRILLVDDEASARLALAKALEQAGYEVVTASDAFEALKILEDFEPDLTLTDLMMPGMSGLDLLQAIRARDSDAQLVLVSGYRDVETAVEAMRSGAFHFLCKPVDIDTLLTIVDKAVGARHLRRQAPLDVCISRKIGVPWQPELGVGAVAEGGVVCLDHHTLQNLGLTVEDLADVIQREQAEVALRVERFRGGRARPALQARTVIVVDDGIAMGGTMRAAIASLRRERPRAIVAAVPVAAADAADALQEEVDQLVSLVTPRNLSAIGAWYEDFKQVSDAEVVGFLDSARRAQHPGQEVSHETVH